MLFRLLSGAKTKRTGDGAGTSNRDLWVTCAGWRISSSTDFDVGTPRLPFGERSAKALYKALLDVEEVLNREELKTLQLCRQMPAHAVEAGKETAEVNALVVQSESELEGAKAWLFARNEMAVSDPDGMDFQNRDVVTVTSVESTRVVDEVTAQKSGRSWR